MVVAEKSTGRKRKSGGGIGAILKKIATAVVGAVAARKARDFGNMLAGKKTKRRTSATASAAGTAGSQLGYEIGKAIAGPMGGRIGRGILGSFSRTMTKRLDL